jgi:hypothetical protein
MPARNRGKPPPRAEAPEARFARQGRGRGGAKAISPAGRAAHGATVARGLLFEAPGDSPQEKMPMTLLPNRISAPMTPAHELELARGLLNVQSEEELDHFLPLLAAAAPMIGQIAGPLLKNLAGGLFGGGGGKKRRPRDEQEQFFGGIVKGLLGEREAQSYEEEQFIGGILKGVLGGLGGEMESEEENYEQEQLLGSLVGKLFGGEMEAPSYEQEQFIGGLLKGVLGGEMEMAAQGDPGPGKMLRRARRFVRLVHTAAQQAAAEIAAMQRAGHRPDEMELRRIVLTAMVNATRRLKPRLAAAAFGGAQPQPPQQQGQPPGHGPPGPPHGPPPGPQHETMLESMISDAPPIGGGQFAGGGGPFAGGGGSFGGGGFGGGRGFGGGGFGGGGRHRHHHGTWVRQGDRITITL